MKINATLRQIEVFLEVARSLSFSGSAGRLHMSQPALSATIRKLETALGARLFDRTSRNVVLTPVGRQFVSIAEAIVEGFEAGMREMQAFIGGRQGRLSIAASPSVMATLVPPALAAFRRQHPLVQVELHEVLFEQCVALLRAGKVDIALMPEKLDAIDLVQRPLFEDFLVVLCSPDHPLATRRVVSWSQLVQYDQIALRRASSVRQLVESEYARRGVALKAAFEVDRVSSMVAFVAAGLGVGMVPYSLVNARELGGVVYRRLVKGSATRTMCAATLRSTSLPPTAEAFLAICAAQARRAGVQGP